MGDSENSLLGTSISTNYSLTEANIINICILGNFGVGKSTFSN
jgi:DNA replication protein DnaC